MAMYILTLKIRVLRFIKKLCLALSLIEKHTHVHTYIECVKSRVMQQQKEKETKEKLIVRNVKNVTISSQIYKNIITT